MEAPAASGARSCCSWSQPVAAKPGRTEHRPVRPMAGVNCSGVRMAKFDAERSCGSIDELSSPTIGAQSLVGT
jgi:hypothetical protein